MRLITTILLFALSLSPLSAEVTPEQSKENRAKICWLFDHFSKNQVDEAKTSNLIQFYQGLDAKGLQGVDAHVQKRIDETRVTDAAKADQMAAIYAEMKAAKASAAAASASAAAASVDPEASKKSRGAICWLFDYWKENPIKEDKTSKLVEHYANLSEKDRNDVNRYVAARIDETRMIDAEKAKKLDGLFENMKASR